MTDTIVRKYEKHGKTHTAEYVIWLSMKARCRNKSDQSYAQYGGRGITLSPEWDSFAQFYADMGPRPTKEYSIDRIDNDKGYDAHNCQWADRYQQAANKRTQRNSKTGIQGVNWCKRRKKYRVAIQRFGVRKHIGYYDNIDRAVEARQEVESQYFQQVS